MSPVLAEEKPLNGLLRVEHVVVVLEKSHTAVGITCCKELVVITDNQLLDSAACRVAFLLSTSCQIGLLFN